MKPDRQPKEGTRGAEKGMRVPKATCDTKVEGDHGVR